MRHQEGCRKTVDFHGIGGWVPKPCTRKEQILCKRVGERGRDGIDFHGKLKDIKKSRVVLTRKRFYSGDWR